MTIRHWLAVAAALALAAPASALTVDFEEFLNHGDIVTTTGPGGAVVVTTDNFDNTAGHPDLAVVFDSEFLGATTDPDLLQGAGWSSGNIAASTELNNLLIVQENDNCTATLCSNPDDQAGVGGQISLDFSALGTFDTFSFDLIDHEPGAGESGSVQFLLGGVQVGAILSFDSFLALGQGIVYGDNSANHIDLGTIAEFDEVVIAIRGSGAIDNIVVTMSTIPEPDSMALGGLGLVMLAGVGRKRRTQ